MKTSTSEAEDARSRMRPVRFLPTGRFLTGTLIFGPGETTKTISIQVIGDRLPEPNETFFVNLSSPTNATIADAQAASATINPVAEASGSSSSEKPIAHLVVMAGWRAILKRVSDVSQILAAVEAGNPNAAAELLPLVYNELRRLAAQKLANEKPGQTLNATALVHEAYVRLVDVKKAQQWDSRRHFFAAAAEAMRRILVENARRKRSIKHGGERVRVDLDEALVVEDDPRQDLLQLDDLLNQLTVADARAAELVKLRFFAGLTGDQAAEVLGISPRSADLLWAYARAWLFERLDREQS